jgi:hypothetical protein
MRRRASVGGSPSAILPPWCRKSPKIAEVLPRPQRYACRHRPERRDTAPAEDPESAPCDALPLERHAVHGTWNYTLHPEDNAHAMVEGSPDERSTASHRRQEILNQLDDTRLTGLDQEQLSLLCTALAPLQAARSHERYSEQRGGRARRATGKLRGSKPLFDDSARVLLTLLYQRQVCSQTVLGDLLETTGACIGDLVKETRLVLEDQGHQSGTAAIRFRTTRDLLTFLDHDAAPTRTAIMERLSAPSLTALTRTELDDLVQRLQPQQAAQIERLGYQRRGDERQPGTRGGVFPQKISNQERVVLTLLYQRGLCTMDVLADALGDVSRSSIGNVIRETRPLLQRAGHTPTPAPTRFRTAAELLAAASGSHDTPTC